MTADVQRKRKAPAVWDVLTRLNQTARTIALVVHLWWLIRYGG